MGGGAKSIGIVGGGVAGLTAAYRLLQRGHAVRVFESGPRAGGLVRAFEVGGEPLECFYHHLFTSDSAATRLIGELGLADTLTWHASSIGVFHGGRLYPFTSAVDLLRFSPVPLRDRVRLGQMALRLRGEEDGARFEDVTAADWVREHAGQRAFDAVWGPLLRGKFGDMAERVIMTWLWHKVRTRFASRRGRFSEKEVLGYQQGSFGTWVNALAARVRDLGGLIETGSAVRRISGDGRRPAVELDSETAAFDAVIATVGNRVFLQVAPPLPESYAAKLEATPYQDTLCLVLALDLPLTRYYWLNVSEPTAPFVAVVEHTNLVGSERYGGRHIVYVSNYVDPQSPLLAMSAEDVFAHYLPHLKRINPSFDESWVSERWLFHGRDAQPVFTVGAGSRIPGHRTPVNGLYLANMGQVYPQDRGQNHSILLGETVAELVSTDLARAEIAQYQV